MPRVSGRDAIKKAIKDYGGSGVGFFSLKEDGDQAVVRFLHTDDTDLDIFVVHQVEDGDKSTYVECLQTEDCPLCAAQNKASLKLFMSMYVAAEDKILVWDRGPGLVDNFLNLIEEYGHLNNRTYKIKRNGAKGSTKTTYTILPQDKSEPKDKSGNDLGPRPEVLGRFIQTWTKEEMEQKLHSGAISEKTERTVQKGRKGPGF